MSASAPTTFARLLEQAVSEPGIISSAYRNFHNYSFGNQLLALMQCVERGIQPGPLATYQRWKELGRYVKRGEKALTLCRPVTVKRPTIAEDGTTETQTATWFIYRAQWFTLSQTDGQSLGERPTPDWDKDLALTALDIREIPFDSLDGNCLGFARGRSIAINPVNPMPHKTRFHEVGHILLGHTAETEQQETDHTPRSLREVEAEAVAMLCCAALGLPGVEFARGYIQHWAEGSPIEERSAQRVLKVADQILKAGIEVTEAHS